MNLQIIQCDCCRAQCDNVDARDWSKFSATLAGQDLAAETDCCPDCAERLRVTITDVLNPQSPAPSCGAIESLDKIEERHILATLTRLNWNKSQASAALGIQRSTLDRKLRQYGATRPATSTSAPITESAAMPGQLCQA